MRRYLVRLVVLFLTLASAGAFAQDDKDKKQALEKFEAGKTAYRLGDYDGAISHWTEAYKLKTDPVFLFNIAQAYRGKKEFEKAITFYKSYLKEAPDAANRETVEKRIAEMKEALDKQQQLSDKPPSSPIRPAEQTPAMPAHDEPPASPGGGLKLAGIITGSAGVALIATGIVFGLMSRGDKSDIENALDMGQPWSQELADKESSGKNKALIANVTLGVGIAAVVGGGVLYYLGVKQGSSVEVRPEISARGFGAAVIVRY